VSRRQRIRRTTLVVLAVCCVGVFLAALSALLAGASRESPAILLCLWGASLAALSLAVAACRVEDDSTDDPQYFGSIVHGLRAEWHRSSTRL